MRERLLHDFPTLDPMLADQLIWLVNRGCEYPTIAENGEPRIKLPQTGEFTAP
jgi:hypothetical protein